MERLYVSSCDVPPRIDNVDPRPPRIAEKAIKFAMIREGRKLFVDQVEGRTLALSCRSFLSSSGREKSKSREVVHRRYRCSRKKGEGKGLLRERNV